MNNTLGNRQEPKLDKSFKIPIRNFGENNNSNNNSRFERSTPVNAYDGYEEGSMQRYPASGTSQLQRNGFEDFQQPQMNTSPVRSDYDDFGSCIQSNPVQSDYDDFGLCFQPNRFFLRSDKKLVQSTFQSNTFHCNPLKRPLEVPKNKCSITQRDAFPHRGDPTLPKELSEQFQPLYCKLCAVQLTSNPMAKLHYNSKNHGKKVRKYLVDYSQRTGEPLHERAQINNNKKLKWEEEYDPKYYHCDICDLQLNGKLHAESHYMGKNHQKAAAGKPPAGKGCYDGEGKWIRRTQTAVLPSERDNIGTDFASPTEFASIAEVKPKQLQCQMCDVAVTSEQQMTVHVNGQKHKKRLQQLANDRLDASSQGTPEDNILSSLSTNNVPVGDLSVYRTPTGYYYCNPCNLSLNSEIQFKQHLGSKKHRKKASGNKE